MMETSVNFMAHIKTLKLQSRKVSCRGCVYLIEKSQKCNWFYAHSKGWAKSIPTDVFSVGCPKREGVDLEIKEGYETMKMIIDMFDGEIC